MALINRTFPNLVNDVSIGVLIRQIGKWLPKLRVKALPLQIT